jgi:hypothetical protein
MSGTRVSHHCVERHFTAISKGRVLGVWIGYRGFPRVSVKVNAKTNQIRVCFPGSNGLSPTALLPFALDAFLPNVEVRI